MVRARTHRVGRHVLQSGYGPSWSQLLRESIENLRLQGLRAILSMLGIAVGCMAVVALLNIGHNAQLEAMSVFQGMGTDLLVASVKTRIEGHSAAAPAVAHLDVGSLRAALPDIAAAAVLIPTGSEARLRGRSQSVTVLGSNADLRNVLDLRLARGRFLSEFDAGATHAVLGANVAAEWERSGVAVSVGDPVRLGGYLFEVVGILWPTGQNPWLPVSPDDAILLPVEGMRRVMPLPQISSVLARYADSGTLGHTSAQLQAWLAERLPGFEINVQIPQQLLDGMAQQSRLFSWFLTGLGGISLLVGGIGVMNVMVMSVAERRREIGVRMALGARPRDIARLFLLEATLLAGAGSLVGAVCGLAAARLFVYVCGWALFSVSAAALPLGVGSAIAIGLIFGLSPALAAARLAPVQALRDA